ncbi:hypothetical protein VNI00_000718 [Paramarasmius palmivorus]|uniref:F-box domain-containing protein n=1 Tax=Paramarasmius palmivorus TaxID=297713 RepID=A0AAW0E8H0_9AGAR
MVADESPFVTKLDTNYVPSPAEVTLIKNWVSTSQHMLKGLDSQMLDLQKRREAMADQVERHQALLSPIRRVNVDVLLLIFQIYCEEAHHYSKPDMLEPPLVLASVCRGWRQLVWSNPLLWKVVVLAIPGLKHNPREDEDRPMPSLERFRAIMERKLAKLNLWLERSALSPLVVSLHAGSFPSEGLEAVRWEQFRFLQHHLIGRLLLHSKRWYEVTLKVPRYLSRAIAVAIQVPAIDIPILRSFSLLTAAEFDNQPGTPDSFSIRNPLDVFFCAPSLQALCIRQRGDHHNLPVPWSRLTELDIYSSFYSGLGSLTDNNILFILSSACPSLRTCRVAFQLTIDSGEPLMCLVFPNLESLSLSIDSRELMVSQTSASMRRLGYAFATTPKLKNFSVWWSDYYGRALAKWPFFGPLSADCALENLTFCLSIQDSAMVHALRLLSSLTSLEVHCLPLTTLRSAIAALTPTGAGSSVLCSRLTQVTVVIWWDADTDLEEALITFASARVNSELQRANGYVGLKSLIVRSEHRPHDPSIEQIRYLEGSGLSIQWEYRCHEEHNTELYCPPVELVPLETSRPVQGLIYPFRV